MATQQCRDLGSSRGPSDLQSDALPPELSRLWNHVPESMWSLWQFKQGYGCGLFQPRGIFLGSWPGFFFVAPRPGPDRTESRASPQLERKQKNCFPVFVVSWPEGRGGWAFSSRLLAFHVWSMEQQQMSQQRGTSSSHSQCLRPSVC